MKTFSSPTEARRLGYKIDDAVYPWVAYKGARFSADSDWGYVRTELEAQLAEALEENQWEGAGSDSYLGSLCSACGHNKDAGHADDCKVGLALKAFQREA